MFLWWKKRREEKKAPKFLGVRLDVYEYLGYTKITYTDSGGTVTSSCNIHFFVDKNDHTKRRYEYDCADEAMFYNHSWMITARLWKINEREIFHSVTTFPSKWLKQYMLDEYDHVWSEEKKWWTKNLKDKVEIVEDNIIKVNF